MDKNIKQILKKAAYRFVRYSGMPLFFREAIQKKRVTILLFHDLDVEAAELTFGYLSKRYNFISLSHYIEACKGETNKPIPEKAMVITFDDGFYSNYKLIPVLKKYHVPATIYLCAGIAGTNRHFWFEENQSPHQFEELIKVSDSERRKILKISGFTPEKEFDSPRSLNAKQINEMKDFFDFQSHTNFHPILPSCTDQEAREEIAGSKQTLEQKYGLKINGIAYPNGDYSQRDIEIAKEAGYTCGVTVDYGFNTTDTDLFRLKRLCVNDTNNLDELIVKATGAWDLLKLSNHKKRTEFKPISLNVNQENEQVINTNFQKKWIYYLSIHILNPILRIL